MLFSTNHLRGGFIRWSHATSSAVGYIVMNNDLVLLDPVDR